MATFGNTTTGSNNGFWGSGLLYAAPFTGGPTSGTLQSISVYVKTNSGTVSVQLGVYGTTTGNLIGSTSSGTATTTAGWVTLANTGTLNDANGNYYICVQVNGNVFFYYNTSTGTTFYGVSETFGTWPSTLSGLSSEDTNKQYCLYFTYTTGGASSEFLAYSRVGQ